METYIITFSINLDKNLKEVYDSFKEYIEDLSTCGTWSENGSVLMITKTTFLASCNRSRDRIREDLTKILKNHNTDGNILIMEVKLSGWTCHLDDNRADANSTLGWLRKYVSLSNK